MKTKLLFLVFILSNIFSIFPSVPTNNYLPCFASTEPKILLKYDVLNRELFIYPWNEISKKYKVPGKDNFQVFHISNNLFTATVFKPIEIPSSILKNSDTLECSLIVTAPYYFSKGLLYGSYALERNSERYFINRLTDWKNGFFSFRVSKNKRDTLMLAKNEEVATEEDSFLDSASREVMFLGDGKKYKILQKFTTTSGRNGYLIEKETSIKDLGKSFLGNKKIYIITGIIEKIKFEGRILNNISFCTKITIKEGDGEEK